MPGHLGERVFPRSLHLAGVIGLWCLLGLLISTASAQVTLNEIVAVNSDSNTARDEDGQPQEWIELFNSGSTAVNLANWALTDDREAPDQWRFPAVTIGPGQYLVVFASGKNRAPTGGGRLHTNFKLSGQGEYLGLYNLNAGLTAASELAPEFPEQRPDYAYGRNSAGQWTYLRNPTPGAANQDSPLTEVLSPVHFSVASGTFDQAFTLVLSAKPGATIRYTTDGTTPQESSGTRYSGPIPINSTKIIRAVAFQPGALPAQVETRTYLFDTESSISSLPILSIVINPADFTGRYGIQGIRGGFYERIDCCYSNWVRVSDSDYFNPAETGLAWERPITMELLPRPGEKGFRVPAGIRVHGSESSRLHYLPDSKFSYNLFFRGDYGASDLDYPLFPRSRVDEIGSLVLRAGHNDRSNPFLVDELVRRLFGKMGQATSHGTFVNVFINGVYKGYYNLTERINDDWAESWLGGAQEWDIIQPYSNVQSGDKVAWTSLLDFAQNHDLDSAENYREIARQLDVTNFADYILVNMYADTRDWTQNNWRAVRPRIPGGKFRFVVWDAEIAMGLDNVVYHNLLADPEELGKFSGPIYLTQISLLFRKLRQSPEFRLLFADRVQKHCYQNGALTEASVLAEFNEMRQFLKGVIPNMAPFIPNYWVPQRMNYLAQHLAEADLTASVRSPIFSVASGSYPAAIAVEITAPGAPRIYYTLDGTDPRVAFTGGTAPTAARYSSAISLTRSTRLLARALNGSTWSALTEAVYQIDQPEFPVRFTEIMYHPSGNEAFEFIELHNFSASAVDLDGLLLQGVNYVFPAGARIAGDGTLLLVSSQNPTAFAARYPGAVVFGHFPGNLSNSGESLALTTASGQVLSRVDYQDSGAWPRAADQNGHSLQISSVYADPGDPATWNVSPNPGGSPGTFEGLTLQPLVEISEVMAENVSLVASPAPNVFSDWIELRNSAAFPVPLAKWRLAGDNAEFEFPPGTVLPANGYLIVWCDSELEAPGLHTGFSLDRQGETILLFDPAGNRIDIVTYGNQVPNLSISRIGSEWALSSPTPGANNYATTTASPEFARINEWVTDAAAGDDDWVEFFNADPKVPLQIGGLWLRTETAMAQVPPLTFLAPQQSLRIRADDQFGPGHIPLKLSATGGTLSLHAPNGFRVHQVQTTPQPPGASQGLVPDGYGPVTSLPIASPGQNNSAAGTRGPQLNEVLAANRSGLGDPTGHHSGWVELVNLASTPIDLGGMRLSNDPNKPNKWIIPPNTIIGPSSFRVIWFDSARFPSSGQTSDLNSGQTLSANGGGVYLFDQRGYLLDHVEYGFQVADRSIGKLNGVWTLLALPTPGLANSQSHPFGPTSNLRLNEWRSGSAGTNEWVEIYNRGNSPVNLSGLSLTDDPSVAGRTKFRFAPLSFIDGKSWVRCIADGKPNRGPHHLGFSLDAAGESLRLYDSSVAIDTVNVVPQAGAGSQGRMRDGEATIQDLTVPTPGASNSQDSDMDGLPDTWEATFGLNGLNAADAARDRDGDGATNLAEFLAGTNPSDPDDFLRFAGATGGQNRIHLTFFMVPNRDYSVLYRSSAANGTWKKLVDIEAEPEPRAVGISDVAAPGEGMRFYKLITAGPPP